MTRRLQLAAVACAVAVVVLPLALGAANPGLRARLELWLLRRQRLADLGRGDHAARERARELFQTAKVDPRDDAELALARRRAERRDRLERARTIGLTFQLGASGTP